MKISYQWLKKYVNLPKTARSIEEALTLIGFEVEHVAETGLPPLPNVLVGEVVTRDRHPNADRLSVCLVRISEEGSERRIVCGADNYQVGDRVPVALPGAELPGGLIIKQSKIRGELSEGMMCSARELGLGEDASGLMILDQRPAPGTPINTVFPEGDIIFDVEVTPNRPDCLSHVGLARELAARFGLDLLYPEVKHNFEEQDFSSSDVFCRVEVKTGDCPHYTAHVIRDVRVGPSPQWLQRDLQAVGLRPINNIVDITNYVLLELGQPLHAFDAARIAGRRLVVRQAADGETITTLDEKTRPLSGRMMVIADDEKPLAVAGIMGGIGSGVDDETVDVVLESAWFRPQSVRWTSKRLGLSSDSSYRFERGVDPDNVVFAAQRAADLIMDIAGGKLAGTRVETGGVSSIREEIHLKRSFVHARCGFPIEDDTIEDILNSLELACTPRHGENNEVEWTVQIPGFRSDLEAPIDLVEEIIRIHGTDKIPAGEVTSVGMVANDDPVFIHMARASALLTGQGFAECMNYTLRPGSEIKAWYSQAAADNCALANPLSTDQTHLRWSLIPGLLENLQLNQSRKTGATRFFECGHSFREKDGVIYEMASVAFIICHDERLRFWRQPEKPDFYTAKRLVGMLARQAGHVLESHGPHPISGNNYAWLEGHSAVAGNFLDSFEARMGLLNPSFLRAHDVEGEVVAGVLEIRLDLMSGHAAARSFTPFSVYPAAERDLALIADAGEPAEDVRRKLVSAAAEAAAGQFDLEEARVFDLYQGQGLPPGKKSIGFTLIFRSRQRTLNDEEVNRVFLSIQQQMAKFGHGLRQ